MGHVRVLSGKTAEGKITALTVELLGLGTRNIDRDTAVSWMSDGHSFVPVIGGQEGQALQLVHISSGDEEVAFIRTDNAPESSDSLPDGL